MINQKSRSLLLFRVVESRNIIGSGFTFRGSFSCFIADGPTKSLSLRQWSCKNLAPGSCQWLISADKESLAVSIAAEEVVAAICSERADAVFILTATFSLFKFNFAGQLLFQRSIAAEQGGNGASLEEKPLTKKPKKGKAASASASSERLRDTLQCTEVDGRLWILHTGDDSHVSCWSCSYGVLLGRVPLSPPLSSHAASLSAWFLPQRGEGTA